MSVTSAPEGVRCEMPRIDSPEPCARPAAHLWTDERPARAAMLRDRTWPVPVCAFCGGCVLEIAALKP